MIDEYSKTRQQWEDDMSLACLVGFIYLIYFKKLEFQTFVFWKNRILVKLKKKELVI